MKPQGHIPTMLASLVNNGQPQATTAERTVVRPHILALRAAEALTRLRTWSVASATSPIAPHLDAARDALGAIVDTWGNSPTGEQARRHRDALLNPGALPSAGKLREMADTWRDTAGRLAAKVGARLPTGTVCV